jgi:hypothetical protein
MVSRPETCFQGEPFGSELKAELLGRTLGPNGAQGRRELLRANSLKYVTVFANRSTKPQTFDNATIKN